MKKVLGIYSTPQKHWVGDGFPVRTLFSYNSHGQHTSPFLMLDYAGPAQFEPTTQKRGVGQHPHRGFETVTIVYQGELEHRDSTGSGGRIAAGDVQWMTAASGILHEEFHSQAFARAGGTLEMVQLWVNLPAADKMSEPSYQTLLNRDIPNVSLPDNAGSARVIAGELGAQHGPAKTFTPMNVWDLRLNQGKTSQFHVPDGHTTALIVLRGSVRVNNGKTAREAQMVLLDRAGEAINIEAENDATVLLLSGEPIDETITGYGPFVMNTQAEISEAMNDYSQGKFGRIPPKEQHA